jgi:hypothetical protein
MIALLLACYTEAEFQRDADIETCLWLQDCFDEDYESCVDDANALWEGPQDPACVYDPGEARLCVVNLREMECPLGEPRFPMSCEQVWDCPE